MMDVLLDTHFPIWYYEGDRRFADDLLALLDSPSNRFFVSEVSVLEVTIKHCKNPAVMPYSAEDYLSFCRDSGFELKPLTLDAVLAYGTLKFDLVEGVHKDPFDRILISQSKAGGLLFATHDTDLLLYKEPLVSFF